MQIIIFKVLWNSPIKINPMKYEAFRSTYSQIKEVNAEAFTCLKMGLNVTITFVSEA